MYKNKVILIYINLILIVLGISLLIYITDLKGIQRSIQKEISVEETCLFILAHSDNRSLTGLAEEKLKSIRKRTQKLIE